MLPEPKRFQAGAIAPYLCGAAIVVVCVNALLFASAAANPLIMSDGWHFVDAIIRPYATGDFGFGDLFAKRGALDHSQPLRKLILLFHYEFFDLDYRIEAIIGVLAAFLNIAVFWALLRSSHDRPGLPGPVAGLVFVALAAVYLSLNSSTVFSWPLVTLNYTSHFFILLFFIAAWWALQGDARIRLLTLFGAGLAVGIVADDTGSLATLAAALAAVIHGFRQGRGQGQWRRAGAVAATVAIAHVAYLLFYAMVAPAVAGGDGGLDPPAILDGLLAQAGDAWRWAAIPLAASVAHRVQLRELIGADTGVAEGVIALVVASAHVWFWWRALRGRANPVSFVAIGLMLLFYGLLAGMVAARVSQHGSDYLWQPRYVLIYEWNLVALLLMVLGQIRGAADAAASPPDGRFASFRGAQPFATAAAVALLLLQVPMSINTWRGMRHLSNFQQRQALQMGQLASDPASPPAACAPVLTVCRFPAQRRAVLMHFLQTHQLSVFSPKFRARNRLYPDPGSLPH